MNLAVIVVCVGLGVVAAGVWLSGRFSGARTPSGAPGAASGTTSSAQGGISDADSARRLARAIASDIALYHAAECAQARDAGVIPTTLGEAIAEGRALFEARVGPSLFKLYDTAIEELVVRTPRD